ncbi:MAG: proton-conducting transporter membrane subunit [Candidatus Methanomethylicia archaeon]
MSYMLTLLIMLPISIALMSPLLLKFLGYRVVVIINSISLLLPGVLGFTYLLLMGSNTVLIEVLCVIKGIGTFAFLLDYLNLPILLSISIVTASVCIYSIPYMKHRFKEMLDEGEEAPGWSIYLMLYTLFSSSMLGIAASTNIIEFYLFLELSLIPSFLLIALYGYGDRRRIALMYFVWTHIGAQLFLIGSLIYGMSTGSFDFYSVTLGRPLVGFGEYLPGRLAETASILMVLGLFFKMAVLGMHFWLPYAHAQAPTPVSALLSPNLIGLAGYGILRIVITLFPNITYSFSTSLMILSIATIIYGGLLALRQDDFKRLLAYSSISQMGYILLGISSFTIIGFTGAILHYLSHAVGKALLFMAAGVFITEHHGLRSISRMGGFAASYPYLFALTLFGVMSLTGLPPSSCLISKFLIIAGISSVIIKMGLTSMIILSIAVIVGIGLTLGYTFWTIKRIFFGPISLKNHTNTNPYFTITMTIIALLGLISFLYPKPFVDFLQTYLQNILGGHE